MSVAWFVALLPWAFAVGVGLALAWSIWTEDRDHDHR